MPRGNCIDGRLCSSRSTSKHSAHPSHLPAVAPILLWAPARPSEPHPFAQCAVTALQIRGTYSEQPCPIRDQIVCFYMTQCPHASPTPTPPSIVAHFTPVSAQAVVPSSYAATLPSTPRVSRGRTAPLRSSSRCPLPSYVLCLSHSFARPQPERTSSPTVCRPPTLRCLTLCCGPPLSPISIPSALSTTHTPSGPVPLETRDRRALRYGARLLNSTYVS